MKKIPLTQGKYALVDNEDFEYLNQWKWHAAFSKQRNKFYAIRNFWKNKKRTTMRMSRFLMNCPEKMEVDHKDGNPLNNQRNNLRICTHSQNGCNRGKGKINITGYKGISWHHKDKRWIAKIRIKGKDIYLGGYKTKIEAAKAYNKGAKKYHGEFAFLNKI